MKFYASIAAGICTIWLGFEPDPDQSSDSRTGFTLDFWISAGYLKKLFTDFDEIVWVDSRGEQGQINRLLSWIRIIDRIQEPDLHRIFETRGIFEEVIDGFRWHFMRR